MCPLLLDEALESVELILADESDCEGSETGSRDESWTE